MNKAEQEIPFSEETIKFRPHFVHKFVCPFNRPRGLLKGWHLFPFNPVYHVKLCMDTIILIVCMRSYRMYEGIRRKIYLLNVLF